MCQTCLRSLVARQSFSRESLPSTLTKYYGLWHWWANLLLRCGRYSSNITWWRNVQLVNRAYIFHLVIRNQTPSNDNSRITYTWWDDAGVPDRRFESFKEVHKNTRRKINFKKQKKVDVLYNIDFRQKNTILTGHFVQRIAEQYHILIDNFLLTFSIRVNLAYDWLVIHVCIY